MRALILLACAAAAAASYIPINYGYGHNEAYKNYYDDHSAKNSYNKGDYGQDASAYKDSSSGQIQGGHNLHHQDHYTSLKHNIDKDKKVIKHKADDHKSSGNAYQYGHTAGGAYQSGGHQQHSDKGHDGKYVAHLANQGAHGYGYGQNAYDAYNAGHNNAYTNYGIASNGKYGSHHDLVAGGAAQGHKQKSFVDHDETIAKENEDYAFKDVKHLKDLHTDFNKAHSAVANHGHSNSNYDHATGHSSKHQVAKGYDNSNAHGAGKGAYGQVHSSDHYVAGQAHLDHAAQKGGHNLNYDNAHKQQGSAYNTNGKERNSYHIKTRKVQKLEHEVNHKDGKSEDNFWQNQHLQNHYGQQGAYNNAAYGASRDNAYNYNNVHQAAYHHQPFYGYY